MSGSYRTGDRVCGYVFDAADGSGTRICIQLQDRCMDHPRHGVTGHAPFADRDSFHARGRAADVMPTDDPAVRASLMETALVMVARYMPELPWFQRRVRFVCKAGHRFAAHPPPGVIVCPECGTEDINLEDQE